jgi:uncharacterized protein
VAADQLTNTNAIRTRRRLVTRCLVLSLALGGCDGNSDVGTPTGTPTNRNNLTAMQKARISIGTNQFEVWLAITDAQQQLGLMQVKEEELATFQEKIDGKLSDIHRGMLFVFAYERPLSFWMHNTITALDIAYIRTDGEIVSIHTMAPLETRVYPSGQPALMALEVKAGLFARLGVKVGDKVQIPDSVLKGSPR